ncbi:MAG: tetratricopeptide repeat protein [Candidatus Omnitrophica bacterium]|nr:tetratricopeptide repeat protein [Candidatus Omnitrophota bacterium]
MQIRKTILIALIALVSFASYFNSLFSLFVWDDNIFLVSTPYLRSFKFLPEFFKYDFWKVGPHFAEGKFSTYNRPFLAASFMFDNLLWGTKVFGFHLSNLILHTMVSILIFLLVDKLTKSRFISLFSALLFSVHPIHSESVSFISGRVDVIALLFLLLSLILFLDYVSTKKFTLYLFSLISFIFSLLAKEPAAILPVIILSLSYLFVSKAKVKESAKDFFRFHITGFFIVLGAYLILRFYIFGPSFLGIKTRYVSNFLSGTAPFWRLFASLKIFTYYMRLLAFPYGLKADYFFPATNSLFEPAVLIGLFLVIFLMYLAWVNRKSNPLASFSIIWFFVSFLPISNIFPQGNVFAERHLYIPSVGFCIGTGCLFSWLLKKDVRTNYLNWKKSMYWVSILLIIALGRVTFERNKVWKNEFTLWYETAKAVPQSIRAHFNLALVYFQLNNFDKAQEELAKVRRLNPNDYPSYHLFGSIYLRKGKVDEAIKMFKQAIKVAPDRASGYNGLAAAYGIKGEYKEAVEACLTALKKNPYLDEARYNLALSYGKLGMLDESIREYEEYLRINPLFYMVHVEAGYVYYKKGDYQKARLHWERALQISKDYAPAKQALELLETTKPAITK